MLVEVEWFYGRIISLSRYVLTKISAYSFSYRAVSTFERNTINGQFWYSWVVVLKFEAMQNIGDITKINRVNNVMLSNTVY